MHPMPTKATSFRLPEPLHREAKAAASARGLSLTALFRLAIRNLLEEYKA